MQFFACPRDRHEQQPPLLFQGRRVFAAPLVRQQPFFDRNDEHDRKLQPLGGVHRHQRHAVVVHFPGVGVVDQAGLLQKVFELIGAGILLVEFAGGGQEFFDVRQSLLIVGIVGFLEHRPIARFHPARRR